MLLPELEIDLLARRLLTRLLDIARRDVGAAEIHPTSGEASSPSRSYSCDP